MSPPALPPFLPSFLHRLRFRPHCHSQQRAFVMMDATPLARSAIHFLTDSELSEKSIVRAFGGFAYCALFLLLPAARRRLSTSMSGVMKCRMENVQLSRGGQFSIFREECTLTASIHLPMMLMMMRISLNYANCRMLCNVGKLMSNANEED